MMVDTKQPFHVMHTVAVGLENDPFCLATMKNPWYTVKRFVPLAFE